MQNNIGIVLRINNLSKQKVIIFDRNLGKLELNLKVNKNNFKFLRLCNGMLIEYDHYKNINIIDVPFSFAKENILFFHHILELCYYFIPFEIEDFEIFDLLYFLFYRCNKIENLKIQKIILGKFFLLLGFYPDDSISKNCFYYLASIPIDRIMYTEIDLKNEKELDLLILKCINMNIYLKSFKTMNFLNKIVAQ